jgi:hypothetical protein
MTNHAQPTHVSCPACRANFPSGDGLLFETDFDREDEGDFTLTVRGFRCPACGHEGTGWNRPTWDPRSRAYDPERG